MFWTELIVVTPHAIAADATTKETTAALVRASLRLLSLRQSVSNGVEINPETKRARSSSKPGGGARSGMSPVSGGVGTQGFSFKRGESRSEQGFRTESTGAMSADHITSDSSSYDQGQQWRDELSGFIRDAESVMERQQNQEGLSLARETAADFRRGEEARQQAEIYYTSATSYTASTDDRFGRAGSIKANEVAAFETFLVGSLSQSNGRPVSLREAQEYWVGLSANDMGRAEQKEMKIGFFESRLRAGTFEAPVGYNEPSGAGFETTKVEPGFETQGSSFAGRADEQALRFDAGTTPMAAPRSEAVDERFGRVLEQQNDITQYVSGSSDDVALQTAITNGEAHVQRYGLQSYVDWVGGEENARIVMGDDRFEQLVTEQATKDSEDKTIRRAR